MDAETARPPRRRDAAATRKDLLTAARQLISQRGVEGTSTRDVAATAGVNQALVYRYFGSKEKLLAEAVGESEEQAEALFEETPLADLPRAVLNHALDLSATAGDRPTSISALLTGANDETIRAILKERIDGSFGAELGARLSGPDAVLRAELFGALITGVSFLREKIGTNALSEVDREKLGGYVEAMIQPLLDKET